MTWLVVRTHAYVNQVERTSIGGSLPVYTQYKNGRTRVITKVRKFSGDAEACLASVRGLFSNALKQALAREVSFACGGAPAVVRNGRIEVTGYYARDVTQHLLRLGL